MAKFLSRLFSSGSSSSKRSSFRSSQTSLNDSQNRRAGPPTMGMRGSASLENLASYNINPKELEKNKLHKASWEGNLNKVQRLARPGQINVKDQNMRTPLHLAIVKGHLNVVNFLVQEDAKLDVVDNEQRTPLIKAVLSGNQNPTVNYHICQALLRGNAGAFINAVDYTGKNALHYAIDFARENLVELFLNDEHCDPNFQDRDQMTPLHLAIKRNNINIVKELLADHREQQADPNIMNKFGQTPLHMAASVGYLDIVRLLLTSNLEHDCDPTLLDAQQQTPFQLAKANHHDTCAKLIDEYEQGWRKRTPRRSPSTSAQHGLNVTTTSSMSLNPATDLHRHRYEQDDDASSSETEGQSNSSPRKIQRLSDQWSDENTLSGNGTKPTTHNIAGLIKNIPLQPAGTQPTATKQGAQTLNSMMKNIPLQPDGTKATTVPTAKPATSQQSQLHPPPPSIFNVGPLTERKNGDNTSTSMSIEKSIVAANPIAPQVTGQRKTVTINSLVNPLPQPESVHPNTTSWSDDTTTTTHQHRPIKQATKVNSWDTSSALESDDDDDDATGVYKPKVSLGTTATPSSSVLKKTQPFPILDTTDVFPTITRTNESKSEDDSIESEVRKLETPRATNNRNSTTNTQNGLGVQNLVNKQIGSGYKVVQPSSITTAKSPVSESSWTTSSISAAKGPVVTDVTSHKVISSIVQQQPLLVQKITESWDDSRPLSADLKRSSIKPRSRSMSTSESSDDDRHNSKQGTIVKAPITSGALASLVQASVRPIDFPVSKSTGVDNLIHIIETIERLSPQKAISPPSTIPAIQKTSTSPKLVGKVIVSSLVKRHDSMSSIGSSVMDDTVRTLNYPTGLTPAVPTTAATRHTTHDDEEDEQHWQKNTQEWPVKVGSGQDFKLPTRKYSNEMSQHSHMQLQQPSRAPVPYDFNSLRGSMSSSSSSVRNMERLSELKEDIKQIEKRHEDSLELKRQLREMEHKMNHSEALVRKHQQLLQDNESQLAQEKNEKQRLEWTTKNLALELKGVKQKLDSIEDEKDALNQRCLKLKEERDNYEEKIRLHQTSPIISPTVSGVLREEDIEKIKYRHREEMKLLSAENDELHQRSKQLQSDLQLHKESLDVTVRYKIDLEKALEEKTLLQHELDRLKYEKDLIEQDKIDYKNKYDGLQEEIRTILLDRSKLEQKLTSELQEQIKQRQRASDDIRKYKIQIEQLNIKLGDAEAKLLVLQTQNEALLSSKDREIKTEFETLSQRLNMIESDKLIAEQRYRNERKELASKQQKVVHEPLVIQTTTPLSNGQQQHKHNSTSPPCSHCNTLQRNYEQEREYRLQTEKDNERLRDVVSRQKQQQQLSKSLQQQQHEHDNTLVENSKQIRSETERVKYELDRLRHDFDKLVTNYEPPNNIHQQALLHAQIDTFRQFYEQEFRQRQLLMSSLAGGVKPTTTTTNGYHRTSSPPTRDHHHHHHHHEESYSPNGNVHCTTCLNSRLLKERLENAIDTSLADQRIQTIKQMPIVPRQISSLLNGTSTVDGTMSSVELLRKRYYV